MSKDINLAKTLNEFRQATMEMDNVYSMFSKSCGLTEAEYWSLLLISDGVDTQSKISEKLFVSRQTLNSAFKQLIKKGFVQLVPIEGNQRSKQAVLTDSGRAFVNKYILNMRRSEENAWRSMHVKEREALTALTKKFSSLIKEELGSLK
ncbi:MAG TPA: MarR family transcriptional regulator [Candidatus Eubacterium faecavium]|nr:MarR family transcriptional regulator [Candidatus Eubacterium faecavium]